MSHIAFGQGFLRLSEACGGEYTFTYRGEDFNFMQSIFYSFMLAIGEFDYKYWNKPENPNFNLIWVLYLLSVTLNNIVMLNLLIAIITDTFMNVRDRKHEVAFKERTEAIAQFQQILPKKWTMYNDDEVEFLTCKKLLLIAEEQEEST